MSVGYVAVQWNRHKRLYDVAVALGVTGYLLAFVVIERVRHPPPEHISGPILLMRACGTCALLMLHVVLCIGPAARLDRRFAPLLYNRRHLGVATFLMGLVHAGAALGFYHGFGGVSPLVSLLASNQNWGSLTAFPFQLLGLLGLLILFLMAATSHDFWLRRLTARGWKRLHMLVYLAYASLVMHVVLGALQAEQSPMLAAALVIGVVAVSTLHIVAGAGEARRRAAARASTEGEWWEAGAVSDWAIDSGRAVVVPGRERVAVFRHSAGFSALTNVCAHQGGPLGEGRIVDGCITCPWHGWQYRPQDGCAPPPFTEKVATHRVRVSEGRVYVELTPQPAGTTVLPAEAAS